MSSSAGSALAGGQHGQYLRAVRLVHHAERLPKRELFMYAATAALLTMFIEQKTQFLKVKVCKGSRESIQFCDSSQVFHRTAVIVTPITLSTTDARNSYTENSQILWQTAGSCFQ